MAEEKKMITIELGELENLLMIAHSYAMREKNLTAREEALCTDVHASAISKLEKHLTGQKPFSERDLAAAQLADALAKTLHSFWGGRK